MYRELDLSYDKDRMTQEILSCSKYFFEIPPYEKWINLAIENKIPMVESTDRYQSITFNKNGQIIRKIIPSPKSLYFRSPNLNFKSYGFVKIYEPSECIWNKEILNRIPYTKSVIERLPFKEIGIVRVFLTENTFLPTHDDATGILKNTLGISLVPFQSGSPLVIFDRESHKAYPVFASSFIFDDSNLHGIPMVEGSRIDVRIFGEFQEDFLLQLNNNGIDKE